MIIQARLFAAVTGLGYRFYDAAGAWVGARVTAGIAALPETGAYAADADVPAGTAGVLWTATGGVSASEDLRDALALAALPIAAATASAVRAELAPELARVDVATSTRLAAAGYTAPDNAGIAEVGAAIADAESILLARPYEPNAGPEIIIPAPAEDDSLCVVYLYTEAIDNTRRAGIEITFELTGGPAKSERVIELATKLIKTNAQGFATITLQRTDRLTPAGRAYLVTCSALGLKKVRLTLTAETYDLANLITA